jgi:tetraacyldisaccharide 4'-kinase
VLEIIRIISSPLVLVYAFIVRTRNFLFDFKIFKIAKVDAKVISIGNLTVGGSGKTPTVMMLAEMLKARMVNVGVLSRGYGRSSCGYLYVSNGKEIKTTVDKCGDEIWLVADELKIPTAVCERRVIGSQHFIKDSGIDLIILDDAFQHRWIHRDLDIVLIDQRFLSNIDFVQQKMLPLGMMREPFSSLKRADIIIINRKFSDRIEIPEKLEKHFRNKNVYHGYYSVKGFFDVKSHKYFGAEEFQGQKSLVVCGIAKPHSFLDVLQNNKIDITNKLLYSDHANYTQTEIQEIRKMFYDTNSHSVLTTQKDAVKLKDFSKELDDIDIYHLKIELKIEEQEYFEKLVLSTLN